MQNDDRDSPLVCALTEPKLRKRKQTLIARLRSGLIKAEELPDGYQFHVADDDDSLVVAAEFIFAERRCCPFLQFSLIVPPNTETVVLRITGPSGTKEFLRTIFDESVAKLDRPA